MDHGDREGADSADEEAFACLDPFEHGWDEQGLGLDDPNSGFPALHSITIPRTHLSRDPFRLPALRDRSNTPAPFG